MFHSEFKDDKIGISHLSNISDDIIKEMANKSVNYNKLNLTDIYNKFPKIKDKV